MISKTVLFALTPVKRKMMKVIKMTTEIYDLLKQCVTGKSADDYVFTREGKAVLDFRGAWWALWVKAGVGEYVGKDERGKPIYEGLLFHDLRRSAVRNMVTRNSRATRT